MIVYSQGSVSPPALIWPSPWGGRCPSAHTGADEETDFGLDSLCAGGYFAAPAASSFLPGQKGTKEPPRGGRNRQERRCRPCLHAAHPLDPHYGGYPLGQAEYFRRAKFEWLSAISSGPLGPGFAKIAAAAVPRLRLTLPGQRSGSVFRRRGGCLHPPVSLPL